MIAAFSDKEGADLVFVAMALSTFGSYSLEQQATVTVPTVTVQRATFLSDRLVCSVIRSSHLRQ